MIFAVVTEVPTGDRISGNLAMAPILYEEVERPNIENDYMGKWAQSAYATAILLSHRTEVFHVGEILILGDDGREIGFPGRKPDKWDVTIEVFDTAEEAAAKAHQVMYDEYQ